MAKFTKQHFEHLAKASGALTVIAEALDNDRRDIEGLDNANDHLKNAMSELEDALIYLSIAEREGQLDG
jgi:hypothetical protein